MEDGRTVNLQQMFTVGDRTYCITLFAPTKAVKLLTRLTRLVGEPIAVMAQAEGGGADKVLEILPKATRALMERLGDEDEVLSLVKALLEGVTREKKVLTFDSEFHGRLGDMMKLLSKVIEVNFEDFFAALGENLQGESGKTEVVSS